MLPGSGRVTSGKVLESCMQFGAAAFQNHFAQIHSPQLQHSVKSWGSVEALGRSGPGPYRDYPLLVEPRKQHMKELKQQARVCGCVGGISL